MEMESRHHLLQYTRDVLGYTGIYVEVGVWKGRFSASIIRNTNHSRLYLIDRWGIGFDFSAAESRSKYTFASYEKLYKKVCKRFVPKTFPKVIILRQDSIKTAGTFSDNTLDFVYLDSDHAYEHVKKEIPAWFPKVKPGGILAGHDYVYNPPVFGVKKAIDEFCIEKNLSLHITSEKHKSWFFIKD